MSKERETFEKWHDNLFDKSAWTEARNEYGYPQNSAIQQRWQVWQACATHYQPLLEAKDTEIARLKEVRIYTDNSKAAALLQAENATLKALLEQAREALERLLRPTINLTDEQSARDTLAAINAATGEK